MVVVPCRMDACIKEEEEVEGVRVCVCVCVKEEEEVEWVSPLVVLRRWRLLLEPE